MALLEPLLFDELVIVPAAGHKVGVIAGLDDQALAQDVLRVRALFSSEPSFFLPFENNRWIRAIMSAF